MENYLAALELSQKINDERLISQTYKIMGNGYYFKNDIPMSLRYYQKALNLNLKIDDQESSADLQNNIALVLLAQNKLDSAEYFLKEAASTYERLQVLAKLSNTWLNWGEVKEKQHQYPIAIQYYQKALDVNKANGFRLQEGYALSQICSALIKSNKLEEASVYGLQAITIAQTEDFQPLLLKGYDLLYRLSKAKHDAVQALAYHEKLLTVKEEVFDKESNQQMEELRTKYESEQKDRENLELLKDTELKSSQLFLTRLFLGLSIVFTLIVCVLAFIYYKALQENKQARINLQKLNSEIQEKNEEITAQAEELIEANHEIASINENLESLVNEKTTKILQQNGIMTEYAFHNAHKVRGPLARILGLVGLIKLENTTKADLPYLINEIEKASVELDEVIRDINSRLQDNPDA
jgi:tetratricopeptide (TPR) repeat protein